LMPLETLSRKYQQCEGKNKDDYLLI